MQSGSSIGQRLWSLEENALFGIEPVYICRLPNLLNESLHLDANSLLFVQKMPLSLHLLEESFSASVSTGIILFLQVDGWYYTILSSYHLLYVFR